METDTLVRMANRIGDFFEAMPDRAEALEGIAQHLKKFWTPRMLRQFLAQVDADDGPGSELKDIVRLAVTQHRALLT